MTNSSAIRPATWILGGILFVCLLVFALCNRISIDDMFYWVRCRELGISGMVEEQFYGYSGRFNAYYLNGFVLRYFNYPMLVTWNLFSILVFFLVFYLFYQSITWLPRLSKPGWVILFTAIIFGSSGPGDQFFWYTQVNTYLWSYTSLLLILFFLQKPTFTVFHGIGLVLCCAFLGGASESAALQLMLLVFIWIFVSFKKTSTLKWIFLSGGILALCTTGYMNAFSEGSEIRSEIIHRLNQTGFAKAIASSLYHYVTDWSSIESLFWLLPLLLLVVFQSEPPKHSFTFIRLTLAYGILMTCFLLPTAWALREQAPARSLIGCDILTALYILLVINQWFNRVTVKPTVVYALAALLMLAAGIIYGRQAFLYAHAYDQRDSFLKSYEGNEPARITPLPNVRMLKSASGHPDSLHYTNYHIQLYYGLQQRIHE